MYDDMDSTSTDWYGDDEVPSDTGVVRLYLDFGGDFGRVRPVLEQWYDETVAVVLPELGPDVRPPRHGRVVDEDHPGGGSAERRVGSWSDALTENFSQISWGWSAGDRRSSLDLYVFRFDAPDHVMLELSITFEDQPGRLPAVAPRLTEFLRRVADSTDPAYGEVALDGGAVTAETLLDMGLYRINSDSAAASRDLLRGYDWVTICPGELTDRLGGVDALVASGAFSEVVPLAARGVLLRAGDAEEPYRPETVHAVFRALAPVLPPGKPRRLPGYDLSRLVFADPAEPGPVDAGQGPAEPGIDGPEARMVSDFAVNAVLNGWVTSEPLPADHPGVDAGLLGGHARVGLTEEGRRQAEELASRLARRADPER